MGYLVYGATGSGSSIVEAALAEAGIDYTLEPLKLKERTHREPPYASVNPHRKVPTLITPAGETITETVAIVLTLAERHPEVPLLPPPASRERALALRWLLFAAAELYPIIEIVDYPERFSPNDAGNSGVRQRALEIWQSRWRTVEGALSDGPFLLGEQFCLTDVYLAVLSRWDLPDDWRAANIPKVEHLAKAVAERPKLRDVWRRNFPTR